MDGEMTGTSRLRSEVEYMLGYADSWEESLEAWIAEAKRLRQLEAVATADFFLFLKSGEDAGIHRKAKAGYATFGAFLTGENLTDLRRYEGFKVALARFGEAMIRDLGVDQLREVARVPEDAPSAHDPTRLAADVIVDEIVASKRSNGVTPSDRTVRGIVHREWARPAPEPEIRDVVDPEQRVRELTAENKKLRKERDAAMSKVAKLEGENAKLRARLKA